MLLLLILNHESAKFKQTRISKSEVTPVQDVNLLTLIVW